MKTIVIVGGGFAGLVAAIGAARELDARRIGNDEIRVILINRDAFSGIRVRNYERDLREVRVPLDDVLGPAGVERIEGEVAAIDTGRRQVVVKIGGVERSVGYDRLLLAAGSRLYEPSGIAGLQEFAFNVDTYAAGVRLNEHIAALPKTTSPSRYTVIVIGAGLTGIEVACEMPAKLRDAIARAGVDAALSRTILADHAAWIGSNLGDSARPLIEQALDALGIERRVDVAVKGVDAHGVTLESGERMAADTVVWTAGMRANALMDQIPAPRDRFGRLPVDEFLRVTGVEGVFAAGDGAWFPIDGVHSSVMSCQHARPMGRFAGHNVVCDLLGAPMMPLRIDLYVTCLDLGAWGALYTEGWDRRVRVSGMAANAIKQTINRVRIYPPRSRNRCEILDWAAPVVQAPPIRNS